MPVPRPVTRPVKMSVFPLVPIPVLRPVLAPPPRPVPNDVNAPVPGPVPRLVLVKVDEPRPVTVPGLGGSAASSGMAASGTTAMPVPVEVVVGKGAVSGPPDTKPASLAIGPLEVGS